MRIFAVVRDAERFFGVALTLTSCAAALRACARNSGKLEDDKEDFFSFRAGSSAERERLWVQRTRARDGGSDCGQATKGQTRGRQDRKVARWNFARTRFHDSR